MKSKTLYKPKKIKFKAIIFFLLIFIFLSLFSELAPAYASDMSEWIAECERRNLLNGCTCDCDKDRDDDDNTIKLERCPDNEQDNSTSCNDFGYFDKNETIKNNYPGNVQKTNLDLFQADPDFIIKDDEGNLMLGHTVMNFIRFGFVIIIVIAIIMAFYGGIVLATAQESDENAQKGRTILKNAAIGFAIAVLGYLIVVFLSNALEFGTDIDSEDLKPDSDTDNPILNELPDLFNNQ